jgi:hypothetical protein
MGARINYVFKDSEPAVGEPASYVVLYSHWGQTDWETDIAGALEHARPRWFDSSYGARMMISYLMQHSILDETGFGLYAINNSGSMDLGEQTVVIDFVNKTIIDNVSVDFEAFINAYGLTERTEGVGSPLSI